METKVKRKEVEEKNLLQKSTRRKTVVRAMQ